MAPDAILADGGDYVLETKLGGEADYFEDIKKLTEWMKLKAAPIKGAFAVLFPNELRDIPWQKVPEVAKSSKLKYEVAALFRDQRPADRKSGSLVEVVSWIAEHVLRPPREVEPDIGFIIKVLAGAVGRLSFQMRGLGAQHFEDIFGGRLVFENILEVKPGEIPTDSMRKAASYLLINQIIFYYVLSRGDPLTYPEVDADALRNPAELSSYFRRVLEVDYAPTFGFDVASRLPKNATDTLRSVIEVVRDMGLSRIRQDVLGKVFHTLIPLPIRKPVAAYYTNKQAADLLARIAVEAPEDKILDPACGSGTLLVACYQRKRRLYENRRGVFSQQDHERFLRQDITGVDVMPFAAHLAVVHLSLQAPRFRTEKVRVAVWDSTELKPGGTIPSLTRELARAFRRPTLEMFASGQPQPEYLEKGTVTAGGVGGDEISMEPVDIVIMNPPFTSSDRLGAEYKQTLKKRFSPEYQDFLQGKLGFQGYFLLLADTFLNHGGRVAAVLPQTTLTGESFGPIVDMLREDYTVRAVVVGLGRSAFSENTALSEILLVAEKRKPEGAHQFALLGTKKSPDEWTPDDIENIVSVLQSGRDHEDKLAVFKWFPQHDLSIMKGGLMPLLAELSPGYSDLLANVKPLLESKRMITYGEYETKSRVQAFVSPLGSREIPGPEGRGGVFYGTSALNICREDRALKKVDRLILVKESSNSVTVRDRVSGSEFKVPRSVIAPNVRRLSYYTRFNISNRTDFLIARYYAGLFEIMKTVYGASKAERYIGRVRERWAGRVVEGSTQLCLARRIDPAAPGTSHIALYTKTPSFGGHGGWGLRRISDEDAKILCLWFNSSLFLIQLVEQRTQTRGTWWRLDKHRFAKTRIPDLTNLTRLHRVALLREFDELGALDFPSLLEQLKSSFEGRRRVDRAWLSVLGVSENDQERILKSLHSYLYETLSSLLTTMGED